VADHAHVEAPGQAPSYHLADELFVWFVMRGGVPVPVGVSLEEAPEGQTLVESYRLPHEPNDSLGLSAWELLHALEERIPG
jgi:hypothetical protein